MASQITRVQADALAALVASLRPEWDVRGIVKALFDARERGSAHDVAHAAINAAADLTHRTPAVIALAGPHWPSRPDVTAPLHYARCQVDGHRSYPAHSCGACRADRLAREAAEDTTPVLTLSPEQAAVNARGVRIVKAALATHTDHAPATEETPHA